MLLVLQIKGTADLSGYMRHAQSQGVACLRTRRQPPTEHNLDISRSPPRPRPAVRPTSSPASLPFFCARRLGFFITTPAAEAQLELDLAEQRCPLDASADRDNLYLTLFTFDALDINFHNVTREFRLAEMLQVRRRRPAAPGRARPPGGHVTQPERRDDASHARVQEAPDTLDPGWP